MITTQYDKAERPVLVTGAWNSQLVTDEAGNTVARHDYRPFGEELIAGDGFRGAEWGKYDVVKQKFTGQEHDEETQFDFFHAR